MTMGLSICASCLLPNSSSVHVVPIVMDMQIDMQRHLLWKKHWELQALEAMRQICATTPRLSHKMMGASADWHITRQASYLHQLHVTSV